MIQRAAKIIKAAKFEDGSYAIRGGLDAEGNASGDAAAELPVIQAAREGAEALLSNARAEAERLLSSARLEAARLRSEAQREAEAARAEAEASGRAAGYDSGLAQGREEAVAAVLNEQSGLLLQMAETLDAQDRENERWLSERTQELAKLALLIAGKLLQGEPRHGREAVAAIAEAAIKRLNDKSRVRLRVAPADLPTLQQARERLLTSNDVGTLELVGDPQVGAGGCLLETRTGVVDARFATQLAEIAQGLFLQPFKPEADPVVGLAIEALKQPAPEAAPAPTASVPAAAPAPASPSADGPTPAAPAAEAPAEGGRGLNKLLAARRKKA